MLAHPESSPPLREPSAKPAIRVPLSRVTYRLTPLLAVLVFVVAAVYLLEVWPRKAPPATEEVNHAPIAIKNGAYQLSLPNGLVYEVSDPTAGVAGGSDKARNAVRSRLASERSSFRQSWAGFWYLLAGTFGLAALLILIRGAVRSVNE
jgi:hypothetical protein